VRLDATVIRHGRLVLGTRPTKLSYFNLIIVVVENSQELPKNRKTKIYLE